MDQKTLVNFFKYLKKSYAIYGPKETHSEDGNALVLVEPLENFTDLVLDERLPFFSFKRFFVPEDETLFEYRGAELKTPSVLSQKREADDAFPKEGDRACPESQTRACPERSRRALFGMSLQDLKSILLYDQVFEKDPYYQARRQNILVIGYSLIPVISQNIFEESFKEDILEHLSFDIFLASVDRRPSTVDSKMAVFTGSLRGQQILKDFGFNDYIHIQFSGPVKEGKLDERMVQLRDKLKNKHNQKIWDELGSRCIECGKCSIVCPTCFCFRIDDSSSLKAGEGQRRRCWDSCYYQEFSEVAGGPARLASESVAGGHKFLTSTAARIHFWYYHKFARIPDEFDFMGCVGCRRCAAVCPVGIDIGEVLEKIENS